MYERGEHRADATDREHESELAGRAAHLLLDDVRAAAPPRVPRRSGTRALLRGTCPRARRACGRTGVPRRSRAPIEPSSSTSRRTGCRPTDKRQPIDTANVPASAKKAGPALPPESAMIHPPTAGPSMRNRAGRTNWSSEFACGSSASGTRSGTTASNAGPKNALPAPYAAAINIMCQIWIVPVTASTPSAHIASMRTVSAAMSTLRRSKRSLTAPLTSRSTTCGTVCATPISASAVGTFEIS